MAAVPVAMVLRTFEPGGTEHQMLELVRRLDQRRWTVHVVCFRATGALRERVMESAASVTEFPVRSFVRPDVVRHVQAFTRWCHDRRIAIVQATGMPTNLFALPAAARARVPVRIGARREINANRTTAQIALQRAAYACATVIAANSYAAFDRLRFEGLPARKIIVIANGLEPSRFRRRPARVPRTVGIVANLRPEKQHDVLINAAPAVLEQFPDARFQVIGDGPERARLEALAASRGVSHAVAFLGHQHDIDRRLREDVDVSVLCSSSEGFPNAVLESLAAGVPVVASDLAAVRELIVDGESGLLVTSGKSAELAGALCRLMADPQLAARLAGRGRAETLARFSFDRMVNAFDALYETELKKAGRSAVSTAGATANPRPQYDT